LNIKKDSRSISSYELKSRPHANSVLFNEVLSYIASPDTGLPLKISESKLMLSDGLNQYDIRDQLPILIPTKLHPYFVDRLQVPFSLYSDPFLQYFLFASVKQSGEINSNPNETSSQLHFFRMSNFLSEANGLTLDIGCDDPVLGASLLPVTVDYIGLDCFCIRPSPFRIIGVGEYLPFLAETFDNVVFNTSLDHILDWRRALAEARKVLKKGGVLYICTYIWVDKADLITDIVHFHHFRYYEIVGALESLGFCIFGSDIYESPKGDLHRHGLYIKAYKS